MQPESINTAEFVEILRVQRPDLIVVVAFGQILRPKVLEVAKEFCMNLHASLLPKYRGAAPINRAIINGDTETGVTTMKMDEGLDSGDILLARKVPINDSDTAATLHDTLAEAGARLVMETIRNVVKHKLEPKPQNQDLVTFAPKLKKEDGLIQWNKSAENIRNLVRGLEPWPGAYTFFKSKRLRVCLVEAAPGEPSDSPGTVVRVSDHGIEVGTEAGRLIITEAQPEGKRRMPAKNFLAGHEVSIGDKFSALPAACNSNPL